MQNKKGTGKKDSRNTSYYKSRISKKSKENTNDSFFDKSKKRQINSYIRAVTVLFVFMLLIIVFIFTGIFLKNLVSGGSEEPTATDESNNIAVPMSQEWTQEDTTFSDESTGVPDENIAEIYYRYNGVYLDVYKLDSLDSLQNFIDRVKAKDVNAVTIDIKQDSGMIPYHINGQFDAVTDEENQISLNLEDIINLLHENGLYVSGNVACFRDDLASTYYANWCLKEVSTGMRWTDSGESAWLNIYSENARKYVKDLITESIKFGFDEIILSYFYLPNVSNIGALIYEDGGVSKTDIVKSFIMDIKSEIDNIAPRVKLGLYIPVKDFWSMPNDTMGINPADLISRVNFFTTSFAPSEAPSTTLQITNAESKPYETVSALCEHFKNHIDSGGFRPIIQAYNGKDGTIYDDDNISKQKQALREAGISVWELVNFENIY